MNVAIIVARDLWDGIGLNGAMPWRLPTDLKRFRYITNGSALIMGRVTYETLAQRALPNRAQVVISSSEETRKRYGKDVYTASTLWEAVEKARKAAKWLGRDDEIYIAGGAAIYNLAMDAGIVNKVYLTTVQGEYLCDTHWKWKPTNEWTRTEHEVVHARGADTNDMIFCTWVNESASTLSHSTLYAA